MRTDILFSQESSDLVFRGRKLVLQYTNGSPCGTSKSKREAAGEAEDNVEDSKVSKDKDDKDDSGHGRKSTIISFHCEKDPLAPKVSASFLGTDPDECAYFFEVRSPAACGGAEPVEQGVGPGGVFGIIVLIAVVVYFVGGVMYQRSVAHARGWRQLPNYSFWAGIWNFFYVSVQDLIAGMRRFKGSRVTSVRDGILPTMEHRPIARAMHRSYGSRPNAAYYPP
jgi:cation-dependent mannose-6-phosphate receptor